MGAWGKVMIGIAHPEEIKKQFLFLLAELWATTFQSEHISKQGPLQAQSWSAIDVAFLK